MIEYTDSSPDNFRGKKKRFQYITLCVFDIQLLLTRSSVYLVYKYVPIIKASNNRESKKNLCMVSVIAGKLNSVIQSLPDKW